MAITPDEALALLETFRDRAAIAAPAMAMAMGQRHQGHLRDVTLVRSGAHAPVTPTPSAPGMPPAQMTGRLRASAACVRGPGGGMHASSVVSVNTIYAATQEWGGVHHGNPHMWLWVRFIGPDESRRRGWVRRSVTIPPRPFMRPSAADVIEDGSVTEAGSAALMNAVFGGGF